jgi:hypothetical protein
MTLGVGIQRAVRRSRSGSAFSLPAVLKSRWPNKDAPSHARRPLDPPRLAAPAETDRA